MNTQNSFFTVILTSRHFNGNSEATELTGTLEELTQKFSNILTMAYYLNHRISRKPRSLSELVKSVNKSYEEIGTFGKNLDVK